MIFMDFFFSSFFFYSFFLYRSYVCIICKSLCIIEALQNPLLKQYVPKFIIFKKKTKKKSVLYITFIIYIYYRHIITSDIYVHIYIHIYSAVPLLIKKQKIKNKKLWQGKVGKISSIFPLWIALHYGITVHIYVLIQVVYPNERVKAGVKITSSCCNSNHLNWYCNNIQIYTTQ